MQLQSWLFYSLTEHIQMRICEYHYQGIQLWLRCSITSRAPWITHLRHPWTTLAYWYQKSQHSLSRLIAGGHIWKAPTSHLELAVECFAVAHVLWWTCLVTISPESYLASDYSWNTSYFHALATQISGLPNPCHNHSSRWSCTSVLPWVVECTFDSPATFVVFLRAFPKAKILLIDGLQWKDTEQGFDKSLSSKAGPAFTTLCCWNTVDHHGLVRTMLSLGFLASLDQLVYHFPPENYNTLMASRVA